MEIDILAPQEGTQDSLQKAGWAERQSAPQNLARSTAQNPIPSTYPNPIQDIPPDISTVNAFASLATDLTSDAIPFYESEGRLLALWDQLNELKLEISLLQAQANPPTPLRREQEQIQAQTNPEETTHSQQQEQQRPSSRENLAATLKQAEEECLEARAAYTLKQSVVENVLVTGPILKAVHLGSKATPTERTLAPLIHRRDILSIASTNLTTSLQQVRSHTSKLSAEHDAAVQKNRELAPTVMSLAREVKAVREEAVASSLELKQQLEEAEEEAREGKRRWRIMKSVFAAVVAGSGVDWAADDELRELVLDDESGDGFG